MKGKYFLYLPNSYYWEVTIDESRLNMLPRVPSPVQLPTIKIHDDPEFQGEDNGPSKHQFDTLHENEEIVSLSGITAPINMKDADDELKELLKKFLGNDVDNWQDVINEGSIMILNVLHLMLSLPPTYLKRPSYTLSFLGDILSVWSLCIIFEL